jgi:hypothetical protein
MFDEEKIMVPKRLYERFGLADDPRYAVVPEMPKCDPSYVYRWSEPKKLVTGKPKRIRKNKAQRIARRINRNVV